MNTVARATSVRTPGFLFGVLGTAFAVALGFGLVVPALPVFARELGASYGAASAVVAAFAGVRLLAQAPAGVLVDRRGARIGVAAGLLIVAVSSAATAAAHSYPQLVVLRGAGGLGSALFITGLGQHIVRVVPSAERGRANGMLQGAFLLGGASGPVVGGVLVDAAGIRAPFLIYAGTLLVAAVVTLRYLRAPAVPVPDDGLTVVVDVETDTPVVHREVARDDAPTRRGRLRPLWRDRTFVAALVVYIAVTWASQGVRFVAVPLYATDVLRLTPTVFGSALTAASAAQALVLWPSSQYADRRGRLLPVRAGMGLYVVGMLGLLVATDAFTLILVLALQGAAGGITSTVPAAIVGDLAPAGAEGKAVGVLNSAHDIGAIAGPLATGFIADKVGFHAAFWVAAALLGLAFAGTLAMRETRTA